MILNNDKAEERADCNCRRNEPCQLEGRCTKSPVYDFHLDIKDKKIRDKLCWLNKEFFQRPFQQPLKYIPGSR